MSTAYESITISTANGVVTVPAVMSRGAFGARVSGVYFTAAELRQIAEQIDSLNSRIEAELKSRKSE